MREEDFVVAARLYGSGQMRIIFRHMLPSFMSHIIATTSLAVPAIIIAETSLSFLGLGLRQPAISWGVLLFEAQKLQAVAAAPWLLMPGAFILLAVLGLNFLGDGLRDAADPYSTSGDSVRQGVSISVIAYIITHALRSSKTARPDSKTRPTLPVWRIGLLYACMSMSSR